MKQHQVDLQTLSQPIPEAAATKEHLSSTLTTPVGLSLDARGTLTTPAALAPIDTSCSSEAASPGFEAPAQPEGLGEASDEVATDEEPITLDTDVRFIITEYQLHRSADGNMCGPWCNSFVPLAAALAVALGFIALPTGARLSPLTHADYIVIEFGHYVIWGSACAIGTSTFLDATAPVNRRFFLAIACILGGCACPGFWLFHLAITGGLAYPAGDLFYSYTILWAIVVPVVMWLCCARGERRLATFDPTLATFDPGLTSALLSDQSTPLRYHGWRAQLRLAILAVTFWAVVYAVLAGFLKYFEEHPCNRVQTLGWYAIFSLLCFVFKSIGKRVGVLADQGKRGTFSMYFALEFLVTLFYYTFYRTLFDKITDYRIFIALQALHVAQEWLLFPMKASEWFYTRYAKAQLYLKDKEATTLQWVLSTMLLAPGVTSHRDLQCVVTMEVGLRVICSLFSAIGFLTIVVATEHGPSYVQLQFKEVDNGGNSATEFCTFTAVAVVTEILNLLVMEYYFFRPAGVSVIASASVKLFGQRRFSWNVFGVSATLLINIIYPKLII